jgi:hypothetical protein
VPNRGLPDEALGQYRAVLATTGYFDTAIDETESFEENLAEARSAKVASLGNTPLVLLSRGVWEPLPISDAGKQQAWQTWQAMQVELGELSTNSKHVTAEQNGYSIQLQQPQLVIDAICEVVQATRRRSDLP